MEEVKQENKIQRILEKYEKRYKFKISLVGYGGLLISNGFKINYLSQDIVTAQGYVLLDFAKTVIMKIMGEAHVNGKSNLIRYIDIEKLPKRNFIIKNVEIEFNLENFLTKEMERFNLIISPLNIEKSYIVLILNESSDRAIKSNIESEKKEIEAILLETKS